MSVRARIDMVEVDDERSGSNGHGGGGRRAFGLDLRRWRRETSDCAGKDTVEADDERSDSKGRGWSVRQAIGFEKTWWRQETSGSQREINRDHVTRMAKFSSSPRHIRE